MVTIQKKKICQFSYIATLKYKIMIIKSKKHEVWHFPNLAYYYQRGKHRCIMRIAHKCSVTLRTRLSGNQTERWTELVVQTRKERKRKYWSLALRKSFTTYFFNQRCPNILLWRTKKSNLIGGWWLKRNIILNFMKMYILKSNSHIFSPFQYIKQKYSMIFSPLMIWHGRPTWFGHLCFMHSVPPYGCSLIIKTVSYNITWKMTTLPSSAWR